MALCCCSASNHYVSTTMMVGVAITRQPPTVSSPARYRSSVSKRPQHNHQTEEDRREEGGPSLLELLTQNHETQREETIVFSLSSRSSSLSSIVSSNDEDEEHDCVASVASRDDSLMEGLMDDFQNELECLARGLDSAFHRPSFLVAATLGESQQWEDMGDTTMQPNGEMAVVGVGNSGIDTRVIATANDNQLPAAAVPPKYVLSDDEDDDNSINSAGGRAGLVELQSMLEDAERVVASSFLVDDNSDDDNDEDNDEEGLEGEALQVTVEPTAPWEDELMQVVDPNHTVIDLTYSSMNPQDDTDAPHPLIVREKSKPTSGPGKDLSVVVETDNDRSAIHPQSTSSSTPDSSSATTTPPVIMDVYEATAKFLDIDLSTYDIPQRAPTTTTTTTPSSPSLLQAPPTTACTDPSTPPRPFATPAVAVVPVKVNPTQAASLSKTIQDQLYQYSAWWIPAAACAMVSLVSSTGTTSSHSRGLSVSSTGVAIVLFERY